MACPDALTLDLWRAGALEPTEAASVAAHVAACATCAAVEEDARAFDAALSAALALSPAEAAAVAGVALAAPWRATRPSPLGPPGAWIALVAAVGGYLAWWIAEPELGPLLADTLQVGLGNAPLTAALDALATAGQALLDLVQHPAFDLTLPLLALLALGLLVWPHPFSPQRSPRS